METEIKDKVMYKGVIKCAHCGKFLKFGVVKEILTPGIKAETQIKLNIEKDDQQKLES